MGKEQIKVELVDSMGSDLSTVNSARVSFDKEVEAVEARDEKLIKYLADHKHMTPFRHNQIQIRCHAPIFLARQLGKHQAGLSWNEVSRRYVSDKPEFYIPDYWRMKPKGSIKQGSSDLKVEEPKQKGCCEFCGKALVYSSNPKQLEAHKAKKRFCSTSCQSKQYRKDNPKEVKFNRWKSSAKRRGLDFNLEFEDIVWNDVCPYLGIELNYQTDGESGSKASLDRIDSSLGYIKGNVQVISNKANVMKNDADSKEIIEFAKNALMIHGGMFVNPSDSYEGYLERVSETYQAMVEEGVAPELARIILPQSHITSWYWTGNLLAFAHVYKERSAKGAQLEANWFAQELDAVIRPLFPASWSALVGD
jgi:thymidylate synthase ThyX